jgi:UDP-glucuronate 4-epimerase
MAYIDSNVVGFTNLLEECRARNIEHLVFASSSSVYGANRKLPFSVLDPVDHPVSLYAATKRSNELFAHAYSHLFRMPTTGLRFFTVYGPWGRPDMALFHFTRSILEGEEISVYNEGRMVRDFTYIDDIIDGVARVLECPASPGPGWDPLEPRPDRSSAPFRIYNLGNRTPVDLLHFIRLIETAAGRKARVRLEPLQPGDVEGTLASIEESMSEFGFEPKTSVEVGIPRFVEWYREYYRIPR